MSGKNKETEMLRASLMKKVSELNDNENKSKINRK